MQRLWIVGAGGHGAEVLNCLRDVIAARTHEVRFADANPRSAEFLGIPLEHQDAIAADEQFVIAIGSSQARECIDVELIDRGARPFLLRAPTAVVGPAVDLGEGAALAEFALLTANIRIGRQFQCNTFSYVAHDCVIGDFVTFAPRVSCNGNVHIGDHAYIGSGAVLRNGTPGRPLQIGAGATIGMGAVVVGDVAPGATVVGNPARPMTR